MATQKHDPSAPWWRGLFPDAPSEEKKAEQAEETAPVPTWGAPSDEYATMPDDSKIREMPIPHRSWAEMEAAGIDPASTTTWRPAIFRDRPLPSKRIGSLAPAPGAAVAPVSRSPQTPPVNAPLNPPPPSPVSTTLSEWWARLEQATPMPDGERVPASARSERHTPQPTRDSAPPRLTVPPPPAAPETPPDARSRQRTTFVPQRRHTIAEVVEHREAVRLYGWPIGDTRCRGCHAYDVYQKAWPEHPVFDWLCQNCQNWLYALARRHNSGDRLAMFRRIEQILRDPRRALSLNP